MQRAVRLQQAVRNLLIAATDVCEAAAAIDYEMFEFEMVYPYEHHPHLAGGGREAKVHAIILNIRDW